MTAIVFHTTIIFSGIVVPITDSYAIPTDSGYIALNILIFIFAIVIIKLFGSKYLSRTQNISYQKNVRLESIKIPS